MKKEVTIPSHDGKSFKAFVVQPSTDLPAPAVVVIQEVFGINKTMREVCENLSQAGYIAICPDLFWRQEPGVELDGNVEADMKRAFALYGKFDVELGLEDVKSTLNYIRKDKECTGLAGTVGYCLGGKLAYLMATRSDSDCNVSYYGVEIDKFLGEAKNIAAPLLMHIAENDKHVPLEAQQKILQALNRMEHVEVHVYPGVDHAFARPGGANYDKEAAHQANYTTADFLAICLGRKGK